MNGISNLAVLKPKGISDDALANNPKIIGKKLHFFPKAFIFAAAKTEKVVISGRRGVLDAKTIRLRSNPLNLGR